MSSNNKDTCDYEDPYEGLDKSILYRTSVIRFDTTSKSKTIRDILQKKIKKTPRYNKLKNLYWGFGLEHEVYFFHIPHKNIDDPITDIIAFNARESSIDLIKNNRLNMVEQKMIEDLPLEYSGRKCGKTYPLEPIFKGAMPEFITKEPFNSLVGGKNPIETYCEQIVIQENDFLEMQLRNPYTLKRVQKYGILSPYPYGMSSYIKVPTSSNIKGDTYKFKNGLKDDYTGSYHVTITLPHNSEKITNKEFVKMHQNFANQIQWIEPLLLCAFFSADDKCIGNSDEKRIKGSFRVMNVAWGNFAGSDVTRFDKGVGRYTTFEKSWRDDIDFYNKDKLKPCYENKVDSEPSSKSLISSNMRTFGATDPKRSWHRESGVGMTIPNGIEIRIFDHFESSHLFDLCRLLVNIAENASKHQTKKYVYNNKPWRKALKNIMFNGWKAQIDKDYIKELRTHLGLKLNKSKSMRAYDLLWELNIELYEKTKKGDIPWLLLNDYYSVPPVLPQVNRRSIEMGIYFKLNNDIELLKRMNNFLHSMPIKQITFSQFEKLFFKTFSKKKWKNDVEDIVYLLKHIKCLNIDVRDGIIKNVKLIVENISNINKTNEYILKNWDLELGTKMTDAKYSRDEMMADKSIILDKLLH